MKGYDWTKTGFPSEVTTNEFEEGIVERRPVTHVIDVDELEDTGQSIPSIITVKADPKLVPVIVTVVPPTDGPNDGETFVITDVFEWA